MGPLDTESQEFSVMASSIQYTLFSISGFRGQQGIARLWRVVKVLRGSHHPFRCQERWAISRWKKNALKKVLEVQ